MADNLSKSLQSSTTSATEGQSVMNMTVVTLQSIRSEESFHLIWQRIEQKRQRLECEISEPIMPRKRRAPTRYEVGTTIPTEGRSVEEYYRHIYYEVIDHAIQAIKSRFNQDGCKIRRVTL